MRSLVLGLLTGSALALAVPAAAQVNMNAGAAVNLESRIDQLELRLDDGIDEGTITRAEARELRPQLRQLQRLEARYATGGFTRQERQDLQYRIRLFRQNLRQADGGRSRYANWADGEDGYNRDDRYDRDDRYGSAAYRQVSQICGTRDRGLAGVIGAMFGSDNCLRVGERAPYGLTAMPSQFRNQFPDGNGYYHRYFDGNVVQVDSRTSLVARIFQVN